MKRDLIEVPFDETNICGSALYDELDERYTTSMVQEIDKKELIALYIGERIVQCKYIFGKNEIAVWGDNHDDVLNVVLTINEIVHRAYEAAVCKAYYVSQNRIHLQYYAET